MQNIILRQFNKQGLSAQAQITQHEVKKVLDNITLKNTGITEFDNEVAHEIWNETLDAHPGTGPVRLRDYVVTMVKAENILKQQIVLAQQQLRTDLTIQANPTKKNQLYNNLFSYSQDHRTITAPFGLQQIKQTKQIQQSRMMNSINPSKSILFSAALDQRQQSTDLKIFFIITLTLLMIDIIVMFQKHHFYTLLGVIFMVCSFVLNYFEKKYVLFLIGWTGVGVGLDLVWMIVHASGFWNNGQGNLRANIQTPFLRFIVFLVCVEMVLKLVLIGLIFKYRSIGENIRKKVNILGMVFFLDGQPDANNLIVKAMNPKMVAVNPFES